MTCAGEIFPHLSGHDWGTLSTTSSAVKSSGMSSQNLYPHLPAVNFLFDFYVDVRTVIKSNINSILRLHLGCKCNLYCTVQFDLKQYYIKTDILPTHSSPTTLLLWTQNEILRLEGDKFFLCTLLLIITCYSISWVSIQIQYLAIAPTSECARIALHTNGYVP